MQILRKELIWRTAWPSGNEVKSQLLSLQPYWLEPKKERNRHTKHTNKKINDTKIDEDVKIEQG